MSELQLPTVKDVGAAMAEIAKCFFTLLAVGGLVLAHLFLLGSMTFSTTYQDAFVDKSTYTNDPSMLCMNETMYLHPCVALDDVVQDLAAHLRASVDDADEGAELRECLVRFYFHGETLDCLSSAFSGVGVTSKHPLHRNRYLHGDASLQVVRNGTQWTYQTRSDVSLMQELVSMFTRFRIIVERIDETFLAIVHIFV